MGVRSVLAVLILAAGLPAAAPAASSDPPATSQAACPDWAMYGRTLSRSFATDCPSPITPSTVPALLPDWFVKTNSTVTASPVVVDGTLFVGDWSGTMYALDADTGAERWRFLTEPAPGATFGPIVSSAAVADGLVVFGAGPRLYALGADDGEIAWVSYVGALDERGEPLLDEDPAEIESSPLIWEGRVYVGMDTHNLGDDRTGGVRGGLLALDAATGEVLWKFEPDDGHGCGGIWSSPTLDAVRRLVYVGSANCESDHPEAWTPYVEAVTAVDADSGEPRWSFQPHPPNRRDHDFGATPNLFVDPAGREVLGAGSKDGTYYALDPDDGSRLWNTKVAEPGDGGRDFSVGGFIGSPAVWEGDVYGGTAIGGPPYYHALDGETGAVRWQGGGAPSYAASAAVNGVVFHGALDNLLKAFDARTGRVLWSAPLAGPISSGPAIVADRVFVGSGTASSDACAKDTPPFSEACSAVFDDVLGATGGIHAFRLPPVPESEGVDAVLLSAQGNQLDAYDLSREPPSWSPLIPNAANGGKDLNAQICALDDHHILLGEDTDQAAGVPQGWGIFDLETRRQVGKLIADYGPTVQPEQYGCAPADDGRIFVTQVGAGSFASADGQLIVFFPSSPALDGFQGEREVCPDGDCSHLTADDSDWCVIDPDIRTAGGMAFGPDGSLYVTEGSPTVPPDVPAPGRVLRYRPPFPTSPADCATKEPETFIQDPLTATPVAITPAPGGHWYVSSVLFPSVVNEYDEDGRFVRNVLPPGFATPFGLAVDREGTLYVADLGIDWDPRRIPDAPDRLGFATGVRAGSVLRVRFAAGVPLPPEVLKDGLDFPDGLGLVPSRR